MTRSGIDCMAERLRNEETTEFGGVVAGLDHVLAINLTTVVPTGVWTNLVFANEIHDTNAEYNPVTGIFTAKRSGYLLVSFHYIYVGATTWTAGRIAQSLFCRNGVIYLLADLNMIWVTALNVYISQQGTAVIPMSVGDTANIQGYQNSGVNQTPQGGNYGYVCFDWLL